MRLDQLKDVASKGPGRRSHLVDDSIEGGNAIVPVRVGAHYGSHKRSRADADHGRTDRIQEGRRVSRVGLAERTERAEVICCRKQSAAAERQRMLIAAVEGQN